MSEENNAPATEAPASEPTAFDAEFEAFLGHTFGGEEEEAPATSEPAAAAAAPAAEEPAKAPAEEPKTDPAPAPANAETPAAEGAEGAEQPTPEVSQADLAAMLGLAEPQPAAAEPAAAPAAEPQSSAPAEDETFMPFQPNFRLPKETVAALFEAEDSDTRERALVGLLSAFGNSITQVIEQRFKEHYAPTVAARTLSEMQVRTAGQAVTQHFYGKHPDLAPYKPAVQQAFKVIHKNLGDKATYSEEIADRVANLARAALKASGINLTAPAAPAPTVPPKKAPPSKAPGSAFEAGGARPDVGSLTADNGPADLVASLSEF
jgi:hypothetical protein